MHIMTFDLFFFPDEWTEIEEEYTQTIALNIAHELLRRHRTNKSLVEEDRVISENEDAVDGPKKGAARHVEGEETRDDTRKEEEEINAEEDKNEAEVISDLEVTDSNRMSEVGKFIWNPAQSIPHDPIDEHILLDLQAWYLTESTEAIASVAPGLCLGALSKVPIEIYKFLIEVPFAKEESPCPFKYKVSGLDLIGLLLYISGNKTKDFSKGHYLKAL